MRETHDATGFVTAVNPSDAAVPVVLKLAGAAAGKATLQLVAPGELAARNTLEARDVVQAAVLAAESGTDVVIATANVGHLVRLADARKWEGIAESDLL